MCVIAPNISHTQWVPLKMCISVPSILFPPRCAVHLRAHSPPLTHSPKMHIHSNLLIVCTHKRTCTTCIEHNAYIMYTATVFRFSFPHAQHTHTVDTPNSLRIYMPNHHPPSTHQTNISNRKKYVAMRTQTSYRTVSDLACASACWRA